MEKEEGKGSTALFPNGMPSRNNAVPKEFASKPAVPKSRTASVRGTVSELSCNVFPGSNCNTSANECA